MNNAKKKNLKEMIAHWDRELLAARKRLLAAYRSVDAAAVAAAKNDAERAQKVLEGLGR